MKVKAHDLYENHPLFSRCIGLSIPHGWLHLLTELVDWLDEYNISNKTFIGFSQIKLKFDMLTIYVEHYLEDGDMYINSEQYDLLNPVREKVSDICKKSRSTCKLCGKEKTEMVVDSNIRLVCVDHMDNESGWWRVRTT
jgi:hypothetical protein